jgi:ABC-type thiamine transport system substrate-binding protein
MKTALLAVAAQANNQTRRRKQMEVVKVEFIEVHGSKGYNVITTYYDDNTCSQELVSFADFIAALMKCSNECEELSEYVFVPKEVQHDCR